VSFFSDLAELPSAADEARHLRGQVAQPACSPGHGEYEVAPASRYSAWHGRLRIESAILTIRAVRPVPQADK
jgi:hypothetical protein